MSAPSTADGRNLLLARSEAKGVFAITVASFGFSWGFIIVRTVGLPPAFTAFIRLVIGASALLSAALLARKPLRPTRPVIAAGLFFGLHQLLFIEASLSTSIALVTLIGALQPLLVALVSRKTVGEPVPRALLFCGALAVSGVGLVVFANREHPSTNLYGLLICVLNVMSFTAFFLASKRARLAGTDPIALTGLSLGIAVLPVAPLLAVAPSVSIEPWQVGLLAVMALVPGIGHLLVNWAHPRVSATLGSIVLALVPVFASIWAHLLFDEPYGLLHIAGTALCLAAVELGRRAALPASPLHDALRSIEGSAES